MDCPVLLATARPSTRHTHMAFDKPPGERFAFLDSCLLLLRVLVVQGSPVSHAELSLPRAKDKTNGAAAEADSFGWIYRILAAGETLEGSIAKAGVGRSQGVLDAHHRPTAEPAAPSTYRSPRSS